MYPFACTLDFKQLTNIVRMLWGFQSGCRQSHATVRRRSLPAFSHDLSGCCARLVQPSGAVVATVDHNGSIVLCRDTERRLSEKRKAGHLQHHLHLAGTLSKQEGTDIGPYALL